ncbi:MAG TPA: hypothetical protein VJ179_02835 [Patescibacteria group bacterium]|nr:hypothetical protein [Patescibacteria group bacterium]
MKKQSNTRNLVEPVGIALVVLVVLGAGLLLLFRQTEEIERVEDKARELVNLVPPSRVFQAARGWQQMKASTAYDASKSFSFSYPDNWKISEGESAQLVYERSGKEACRLRVGVAGHELPFNADVRQESLTTSQATFDVLTAQVNDVPSLVVATAEKEDVPYILELVISDGKSAYLCKSQFFDIVKSIQFGQ